MHRVRSDYAYGGIRVPLEKGFATLEYRLGWIFHAIQIQKGTDRAFVLLKCQCLSLIPHDSWHVVWIHNSPLRQVNIVAGVVSK
jgi:hypothetical protein